MKVKGHQIKISQAGKLTESEPGAKKALKRQKPGSKHIKLSWEQNEYNYDWRSD